MLKRNFAVIILAAGKGVRMKSALSKVLHPIAGRPMLERIIRTLKEINPAQIIVVVNPQNQKKIKKMSSRLYLTIQKIPKGTADAVKKGLQSVVNDIDTIAVMYGDDTAFYNPQTILDVYQSHINSHSKITFVTVDKDNPTGLGRIIRKNGRLIAIVEEKDALPAQKKIKEVNDGLYFFEKSYLRTNLTNIKPSKVSGELYITDLIGLALKNGEPVNIFRLKDNLQWHPVDTQNGLKEANIKFKNRVHIMGISGAGAAAVGGIASSYGYIVNGCDLQPQSPYTKNLKGINIKKGHDSGHLTSVGLLIVSPAILKFDPQNEEILKAKKRGLGVLTWQQFQGEYLQKDKFVISVAGAYGKSTTTSMISQILVDAKLDPTCEVGANVLNWDANFRVGKSKYYVCEADEYNDNFLNYQSDIAVVLNLAWDHPDYFKTRQQLTNSYKKFIDKIGKNGTLVIPEDPQLIALARSKRADIKVETIENFGQFSLKIIGDFRKGNAQAALAVAKILKLDLEKAKKSLSTFAGVGRRLEFKGEIAHVKVYDDYAVQPYTVAMTTNALCKKFPNQKVVLVFEPHTFSRINIFFDDFVKSLKNIKVDKIFITDVYAAREKGDQAWLSQKLAEAVGKKAIYSGLLAQTARMLRKNFKDFDIILSMGAGDIYKLYDFLKKSHG